MTRKLDLSPVSLSRYLPLAAQPDALFGFHLRHLEQPDQHAELVTPRHPRQSGDALRDEDCSLLRPAILHQIIVSRTAIPARGWARSPPPCLGQKLRPVGVFRKNTPSESATMAGILQLF